VDRALIDLAKVLMLSSVVSQTATLRELLETGTVMPVIDLRYSALMGVERVAGLPAAVSWGFVRWWASGACTLWVRLMGAQRARRARLRQVS